MGTLLGSYIIQTYTTMMFGMTLGGVEHLQHSSQPAPGCRNCCYFVTKEIKSLFSCRLEEYQSDNEEDRDAEDGGDGDYCTDELCPLGIVYFDLIILEGEGRGRRDERGSRKGGRSLMNE